jgi:hypothetical protein
MSPVETVGTDATGSSDPLPPEGGDQVNQVTHAFASVDDTMQPADPGHELYASGERKRVRSACVACHERKLRCVMLKTGTCQQCLDRDRPCEPRVEKKRGRPRNSGRLNQPNAIVPQLMQIQGQQLYGLGALSSIASLQNSHSATSQLASAAQLGQLTTRVLPNGQMVVLLLNEGSGQQDGGVPPTSSGIPLAEAFALSSGVPTSIVPLSSSVPTSMSGFMLPLQSALDPAVHHSLWPTLQASLQGSLPMARPSAVQHALQTTLEAHAGLGSMAKQHNLMFQVAQASTGMTSMMPPAAEMAPVSMPLQGGVGGMSTLSNGMVNSWRAGMLPNLLLGNDLSAFAGLQPKASDLMAAPYAAAAMRSGAPMVDGVQPQVCPR